MRQLKDLVKDQMLEGETENEVYGWIMDLQLGSCKKRELLGFMFI